MDCANVHAGKALVRSEVFQRKPLNAVLEFPTALSVNVNATIFSGLIPAAFFNSRMFTIRREITCVLPDPAQAMICRFRSIVEIARL